MTVFRPDTVAALAECVRAAAAESCPLALRAGGSKEGLGRPVVAGAVLELSGLCGVIDHDPPELVFSARAATRVAEITALLAAHGQMLGFEPPGWHRLYGDQAEPTIGGVLAANMAGPRRLSAGAARDHLLGFTAVNGFGEVWKAGGRVVKNVSGFDMARLQCGAMGTLSVLAEVTLRVFPRPAATCSLVLAANTPEDAVGIMTRLLVQPFEISAAAYLPAGCAERAGLAGDEGRVVLRLEGPAPSIAARAQGIERALSLGTGLPTRLAAAASMAVWERIGAVASLLPPGDLIWRLCPPPSGAAGLLGRLRAVLPDFSFFIDWGGGLIWLALPAGLDEAGAGLVRAALGESGRATLIRAAEPIRRAVPVFQPDPPALEALQARVKAAFDPAHLLNPGRIVEGR